MTNLKPAKDSPRGKFKVIKWTVENDRKLLLHCLGRQITSSDYNELAQFFPGT